MEKKVTQSANFKTNYYSNDNGFVKNEENGSSMYLEQEHEEYKTCPDDKGNKDGDPYFWYRMTKQICLVGVWICIGLSGEMSGPTLPDLKDRVGVDYEEISRALVGKSAGLMLGSVLGGFLHEVLYRHTDLLNALSLMLMAVAAVLTPWSTTVAMAASAFFLNGFGEGVINTGGNTMVMHLWGERATSPMHSLHFGFGFGALLAPQIARPFLAPVIEGGNGSQVTTMSADEISEMSRIEIPYSIAGVLVFLFSLIIVGFYIKGPPPGFPIRKNMNRFSDMVSPGSCAAGHSLYGFTLFVGLFLYFIQAVGGERAYGKFLFSYAFEMNLMDKDTASILQSVFWLSFTTGRLLGIPLTKFLPLSVVIIGDICLAIISSCVLAIFSSDSVEILWGFTVCMGLAIAVVFPNGMSWANLHLAMNSIGVMVLMVGGSCGGFIYQSLTGSLFENQGPQTLMYVMLGYSICLLASYIFMVCVTVIMNPQKTSYTLPSNDLAEDSVPDKVKDIELTNHTIRY